MKVVSTFHPSSSVLSSLKCRLGTRDIEHLVVAKLSRLDVYSVRPHGLQHECGVEVWGKICSVKAIPLSVSRVPLTIPSNYL
jgi:DNA damage-binding protein 1